MSSWSKVALVLGAMLLASGMTMLLMWPGDDQPQDPDAIVVLGGAGVERVDLGLALLDQHPDAALVLSASAAHFGARRDLECDVNAMCIDPEPETTAGEARTVAELADERGWGHVTVATSRFHTTRARLLFRQCLGDRVTVVGAAPAEGRGARGIEDAVEETVGAIAGMTIRRAC
jgi:uncharacterized SAM-binding protein YcdF (DUF218 family)